MDNNNYDRNGQVDNSGLPEHIFPDNIGELNDDEIVEKYLSKFDMEVPDVWNRVEQGISQIDAEKKRKKAKIITFPRVCAVLAIAAAIATVALVSPYIMTDRKSINKSEDSSKTETNYESNDVDYEDSDAVAEDVAESEDAESSFDNNSIVADEEVSDAEAEESVADEDVAAEETENSYEEDAEDADVDYEDVKDSEVNSYMDTKDRVNELFVELTSREVKPEKVLLRYQVSEQGMFADRLYAINEDFSIEVYDLISDDYTELCDGGYLDEEAYGFVDAFVANSQADDSSKDEAVFYENFVYEQDAFSSVGYCSNQEDIRLLEDFIALNTGN